jgi:hypothetical protein
MRLLACTLVANIMSRQDRWLGALAMNDGTKSEASHHTLYLSALQNLADQSRAIAKLMPHRGERGRIAEEIVKSVLDRILPKRFSIGTGVVFSADGKTSAQTDIVIYDNFYNSPLLSEFGSCMFPVETVFATIEVKSVLNKLELRKSIDAIMQMRSIGSRRHYMVPGLVTRDGNAYLEPTRQVLSTPPRNYIVAFSQSGLGPKFEDFCLNLQNCLEQDHSHVHGVCVLNRDWFAGRLAHRPGRAELFGSNGHGLLSLYASILKAQQNFAVYPMDVDAYLPEASADLPYYTEAQRSRKRTQ